MKTRTLLVALAALLLPGVARAADWVPFQSEAGRFTVQLPAFPQEQNQEMGDASTHVFVARPSADRTFLVSYTDPNGAITEAPAEIFNAVRDSFLDGAKATLKGEQDATFAGRPGREFTAQGANGTEMKGRFILDANRLYIVVAITAPDPANRAESDRFLASFALAKK